MKLLQTIAFTLFFVTAALSPQAQEKPTEKKIYHNYLLKWKDSLNLDTKNEVMKIWYELPKKVDGVLGFEIIDLTMSIDKYNTIIIVVFKDKEAYAKFTGHPDYARMAKLVMPMLAGLTEFDYLK